MKTILAVIIVATLAAPAWALTVNMPVTPTYVKEHAKDFSVKVVKGENGLLNFTVIRTLSGPMYLVANLKVRHGGEVVAESSTPVFARKGGHTFYFSIRPEDAADSSFELGEYGWSGSDDDNVPVVGGINYQFRLRDFVPVDASKPDTDK